MIINSLQNVKSQPIFFEVRSFIERARLYVKLEGLNLAGSIKLKTAKFLIDGLERDGLLEKRKSIVIESSSGNLGIALALICKERGYGFACVVDPNILPDKEKILKLYGAQVIKVTEKDISGGYLATRISTIKNLITRDSRYVWTNQYANKDNISAHYHETAREILDEIKSVDYLFIGAGTTGTLMGCAQYFKKYSPKTKIVVVDAKGSVTFGDTPATRKIPGIGTSRKPELVDTSLFSEIVWVDELDTIKMCRSLLKKYGLFVGGSSGSVLSAVESYFSLREMEENTTVVAISPDFGHPYACCIYDDSWVNSNFGCGGLNEI